jgi:hypothetical protein
MGLFYKARLAKASMVHIKRAGLSPDGRFIGVHGRNLRPETVGLYETVTGRRRLEPEQMPEPSGSSSSKIK